MPESMPNQLLRVLPQLIGVAAMSAGLLIVVGSVWWDAGPGGCWPRGLTCPPALAAFWARDQVDALYNNVVHIRMAIVMPGPCIRFMDGVSIAADDAHCRISARGYNSDKGEI